MLGAREVQRCEKELGRLTGLYGVLAAGVSFFPAVKAPPFSPRTLEVARLGALTIDHDERGGPVVALSDGSWNDEILVSLTDEGNLAACAWARVGIGSPVVGIGVDLADRADFAGKRGAQFNYLILTECDRALVDELCPHDHALGCAFAFSAKEAAFKACAAPLRAWYRSHDEELVFDLRSFQLDGPLREVGTARRGEAGRAMRLLGIDRIELARVELDDLALTFALALGERARP